VNGCNSKGEEGSLRIHHLCERTLQAWGTTPGVERPICLNLKKGRKAETTEKALSVNEGEVKNIREGGRVLNENQKPRTEGDPETSIDSILEARTGEGQGHKRKTSAGSRGTIGRGDRRGIRGESTLSEGQQHEANINGGPLVERFSGCGKHRGE